MGVWYFLIFCLLAAVGVYQCWVYTSCFRERVSCAASVSVVAATWSMISVELVRGGILLIDVIRQRLLEKATAKGVALGRQQVLEMSEAEFTSMKQRYSESSSDTEVTESNPSRDRIGFTPAKHDDTGRKLGDRK